ncbi:hypothetical protein WOC76_12525 [Methylocystis sp. IM3]
MIKIAMEERADDRRPREPRPALRDEPEVPEAKRRRGVRAE